MSLYHLPSLIICLQSINSKDAYLSSVLLIISHFFTAVKKQPHIFPSLPGLNCSKAMEISIKNNRVGLHNIYMGVVI